MPRLAAALPALLALLEAPALEGVRLRPRPEGLDEECPDGSACPEWQSETILARTLKAPSSDALALTRYSSAADESEDIMEPVTAVANVSLPTAPLPTMFVAVFSAPAKESRRQAARQAWHAARRATVRFVMCNTPLAVEGVPVLLHLRLDARLEQAVGNVGLEFVQVPELPRTMTGKILRSILHALIRDDRDAFLRASRAVQNPHCLRNLQQQLHEWRRLHSHFTSASGPLAKDAARVASASQLFEDDSAFGRSPLESEQEEESPPGKEGLRRNGGGEQEASRRHAGQRARPPETEAGATDAACTSQGATCSSGSRAASPEAGTRQGPSAGAASAGSAGARRRQTRSRLRLEEEEEESDEEEEDASEVGEPPRWRRGQRRRPRPRQPEPWEVTLDLRFLAAFGAGAALMAALAAAQSWRRRTLGE